TIPSIDLPYIQLSNYKGKRSSEPYLVSALERFKYKRNFVKSYEIQNNDQLKYIIELYGNGNIFDEELFYSLPVENSTSPLINKVEHETILEKVENSTSLLDTKMKELENST